MLCFIYLKDNKRSIQVVSVRTVKGKFGGVGFICPGKRWLRLFVPLTSMFYSPAVCQLILVTGQKGVNEGDPQGSLEMG